MGVRSPKSPSQDDYFVVDEIPASLGTDGVIMGNGNGNGNGNQTMVVSGQVYGAPGQTVNGIHNPNMPGHGHPAGMSGMLGHGIPALKGHEHAVVTGHAHPGNHSAGMPGMPVPEPGEPYVYIYIYIYIYIHIRIYIYIYI
jgi:hypothetical protein